MKKTPVVLGWLMAISLLVITGFQVYWLRENYYREKKSLEIHAQVLFQEAVRNLQTQQLKIDLDNKHDSTPGRHLQMIVRDDSVPMRRLQLKVSPGNEVVTMVNTLRKKLKDSLTGSTQVNSEVLITLKKGVHGSLDSMSRQLEETNAPNGNRIIRFLYGVDSLQDTLTIPAITKAYQKELQNGKMDIPFTVQRLKDPVDDDGPDMSTVTVGFAKPISYQLQFGNLGLLVLKRIILPVIFSFFLVGFTVFSFILFYRTVLRQQRLAAIKNDFISNITHELKTPIATVGVAIEALQNFNAVNDVEKTREYLDISGKELSRLSLLVDKVLKLSILERKETHLQFEWTNLDAIVQEAVGAMQLQLNKANAVITIHSTGNLDLKADRVHLLSVLYNLIDNAIKYGGKQPQISISSTEREQYLLLEISDNGIGIAPEYRKKIFEKFFRVPAGDTHNAAGYGLGLSYVALIVAQHHGSISVQSETGRNTTFTILLPKYHER